MPDYHTVTLEDVEVVARTDKAVLIRHDGHEAWIPNKCINDSSEVPWEDDEGSIIMTRSIAEEKGFI